MKKLRQELVLITGMSGSGKSVALHALEDAGYLCVDNLPPELLRSFVQLEQKRKEKRIAIAMDVRSAASLPLLPQELDLVRQKDVDVRMLFFRCQHRHLGSALFRNPPPSPAVAQRCPQRGPRY